MNVKQIVGQMVHPFCYVVLIFTLIVVAVSYQNDLKLAEVQLKIERDEVAYQKYESAEWEKCYRWWRLEESRTREALVRAIKSDEFNYSWMVIYRDRWIESEKKLQKIKDVFEPESPGKGKGN